MFKNIRQRVNEEGVINVGAMIIACLTIIGSLVGIIYSSLLSSDAEASQRITALENRANTFTSDIAGIRSDVSWIRSSLETNGIKPR